MSERDTIDLLSPALRKQAERIAGRVAGGCGGLDADDLFQEGLMAALGAAKKWRADGGASLKEHCLTRGVGEMRDAVRRASRNCRRKGGRLYQIARVVPISVLVRATNRDLEFEGRGFADPGLPARPEPPAPSRSRFARALRKLPPGQPGARDAALMYFADDMTMKEIGRALGLGESRVSQLIGSFLKQTESERAYADVAEVLGVS